MRAQIMIKTSGLFTVKDLEQFAAAALAAGIPGNHEVLIGSPQPNDGVHDVLTVDFGDELEDDLEDEAMPIAAYRSEAR